MNDLAEEMNDRFSDLRALKPSFFFCFFFFNFFLLDKIKNDCPVSRKIVVDFAAV